MSEDNQEMRKLAETSAMDYNLLPELIETAQQQCSKIQSINLWLNILEATYFLKHQLKLS